MSRGGYESKRVRKPSHRGRAPGMSAVVPILLLLVPSTEMNMRLLTVTARTQGERADDFCFGVEGEPAWVPTPCVAVMLQPDATPCQCFRAFAGVTSGAPSSTALVIESDLSRREIEDAMRKGAGVN